MVDKLVSSSDNTEINFFESKEASGMNSVISLNNKDITKKIIRSTTLDVFCKSNNIYPDIIKVDIEGSEIEMLNRCKKNFKKT